MTTIKRVEISDEMKTAYLNYAMSVIVSRALPDVRDGLKPVHRRILYAMHKMGISSSSRYSKSAKIVGEVLGKYHPHGDTSVYEALVRMAQDFSMRYMLIQGQGNFGSVDGDPPAAMRYTEAKMSKIAEEMLADIEKETVIWTPNFDSTLKEPEYLPSKLPNVLLMGAEGIAVGMATKIPPHNLTEVIDALIFMISKAQLPKEDNGKEKKEKTEEELFNEPKLKDSKMVFETNLTEIMEFIKGPDFPTGGLIYGASDIQQAYATGKGKMLVRAKVDSEDMDKGRTAIIISELPYQVNKASLVEKIANLVRDKKIVGISDIRDESDRKGIRVVIELKRDAVYKKIVNNLYKYTELQTSFPMNMVVLVDKTPHTLSLKTVLELYINHRIDVITKRTQFELNEAKARAHILEGLLIALDHIDEIIEIIKKSPNEQEAKKSLISKFGLSEIQAQAILDMQLKRLTGLERKKIEDELKALQEKIAYLESLLKDIFKILAVIKDELLDLRKRFGDERKTRIFKMKPGEFSEEELIENKEVIVALTKEGYIKHVPRETFKVQHRGGKGVSGFDTKDEDNVYFITTAMTHDYMLFFTNKGKVYQTRVWDIPQGTRISKGKALINVIQISPDEKITSILSYSNNHDKSGYIFMCTKKGTVKKTILSDFRNIRQSGIIAIKLDTDDELLWASITNGGKTIVLASKEGKAIVFDEKDIRPTGRSSMGVRGMRLDKEDNITSMDIFDSEQKNKKLIVITENGIGKKTRVSLFREQNRGGKGVKIANLDERTGNIAFSQVIEDESKTLLITSKKGQVVKIPLTTIPDLSRVAKGVILMRFSDKSDRIASATFI